MIKAEDFVAPFSKAMFRHLSDDCEKDMPVLFMMYLYDKCKTYSVISTAFDFTVDDFAAEFERDFKANAEIFFKKNDPQCADNEPF